MRKITATYYLILLSFCISSISFGQEVDYNLREIKVRANLQAYYEEDTRTDVLDSILQQRFALADIGQVLKQQGGIVVSSYGSRGSLSGIKIRGTGDNHTRFMWNGVPVNSLTAGTLDASLIPAGFMESVSITKSASGVLAGNASFGGTVNLDNSPDWEQKFGASIVSELGSFGYKATMPSIVLSSDNIQYKANFQYVKSDNDFPYKDTYKAGAPLTNQFNDSLVQWGLIQNLFIRIKGHTQLDIGLWVQDKNKDIPGVMGSYKAGIAHQQDRSLKSYIKMTRLFLNSRLLIQLAYLDDSLQYIKLNSDNPMEYLIDSHIGTSNLFTKTEWRWFASQKFSFDIGAHTENPRAVVDAYGLVRKEFRASLFAAGKYRIGSWIVNTGVRKDFNPYNPPKPLGSFGISWKSEDNSSLIRANISNKFRIPTFNERYWQPGGNPDLSPESGWGGELGWKWEKRIGGHFLNKIEPVIFYQEIKDWIQWIPSDGYWMPQNQSSMRSQGFEFSGLTQLDLKNSKFDFIYNYSFTDAVQADISNPDKTSGVIYVPRHQVFTALNWNRGGFNTGISYHFLNERFTTADLNPVFSLDAVHLVNLSLSHSRKLDKLKLEIYIKANNILNFQYQMIRSYASPGISGVLGLKIIFVNPKKLYSDEN